MQAKPCAMLCCKLQKKNHEKSIKGSSHVKLATVLIVATKSNKNTCNLQKTQVTYIKISIKFDCKQRFKHNKASLIKKIEQNFNKNELYKHEGGLQNKIKILILEQTKKKSRTKNLSLVLYIIFEQWASNKVTHVLPTLPKVPNMNNGSLQWQLLPLKDTNPKLSPNYFD